MEEKREKQFRRIICCLLPLCLFLVWVNILPVSAQTQLSASAQIQSAAPWGTETVKETRAYYDGAYWRVPAGWYHYQPTKDVWKDLLVSNSEDYFTDYYVAVWKKADGGYELAGQIGDVAHQVQGSTSVSICWNKDVDYYIQIVSDSKETFRLDVSWTLEITRRFFRNYPLLLLYPMYLNFASSNCLPHLPYIVRFIIFNLLLVPSTNPLL